MRDDLNPSRRSSLRRSGGGAKTPLVNVKFDDLLYSLSYLHEKACERSRVQEIQNSTLRLRLGLPENAVVAGAGARGSRASRLPFDLPAEDSQPNIVRNLSSADQDVTWSDRKKNDLRREQSTRQNTTGQVAHGPPEPSAPESPRMPDIFEEDTTKPMEPNQTDYTGELELLDTWVKTNRHVDATSRYRGNFFSKGSEIHVPHLHVDLDPGWKCSWVMRPNGTKIVTWEVATSVLLAFDLATLPMQVFDEGNVANDFMKTTEYISAVTWTIDMFIMFFKGYEICGDCELRWNYIIRNYLRTWFLFDLLIISFDWILVANVETALKIDFLRFTRLRRFFRLIRLFRVVKHAARIAVKMESLHSEDSLAVVRLVWILILLISITHCFACGWYGMGRLGNPDENWIDSFFTNSDRDYSIATRYLLCFHWATAQFTPAPMSVEPTSATERVYNICVIFSGLLMFSSFLSAMTGSMTFLTKRAFYKRRQRDQLLNFMSSQSLSPPLKHEIYHYFSREAARKKTLVQAHDIEVLQALPHGLTERLHVELHTNTLKLHPLFSHLSNEEPKSIQKLCHLGMSETALQPGEELFRFGVRCTCMYFQVAGTCDYKLGYGEDSLRTSISTRQWLCEMSLWVHWEHRGLLTARTEAELAQLDSFEFQRIMSRSKFFGDLRRYAAVYSRCAENDCNGPENIPDSWGQRLRVTDFISKCFMANAPAKNLAMMFCGNTGITEEEAFRLWKDWSYRAKIRTRNRNPRLLALYIRKKCAEVFESAKLQIRQQLAQNIASFRTSINNFRKSGV